MKVLGIGPAIGRRRRSVNHGEANRTAEWRAWRKMRERCYSVHCKDYPGYGGRGISVCAEWEDYLTFLRDVGRRPSPAHSLGRKDNDGPYCPSNCEWQTASAQARNRRTSRLLTHDGLTLPMAEWADRVAIPYSILLHRISAHGWSVERALTSPIRSWPHKRCA